MIAKTDIESLSDYENKQYADFWSGKCMELLNIQEKNAVKRLMRSSSGWFLDVGCGFGRFSGIYRNLYTNKVLVDYSIRNLKEYSRLHNESGNYYVCADACSLPFRDDVFDMILSARLIQNVPDPDILIETLNRILKPNSRIVMSYFNRRNLLRLLKYGPRMLEIGHIKDFKASFGDMYGTHPRYFEQLINKHNLVRKETIGVGFSYQLFNNFNRMQQFIESSQAYLSLLNIFGLTVDCVLGILSLSLWQFIALEKKNSFSDERIIPHRNVDFTALLRCPQCHGISLHENNAGMVCDNCGREYAHQDGIYDFRI